MSVRLSEIHDSDNEATSSMEGVNALRARFEMFGHGGNTAADKQNFTVRSPSPHTAADKQNFTVRSPSPHKPSTPPPRRTQGPPRPPPPKPLEKPRRFSDSPSEVFIDRVLAKSPPLGQSPQSSSSAHQHPLAKSKSKSVSDLKTIRKEAQQTEVEDTDAASNDKPEEVVDTLTKKGKKGKKSKNKTDLKEEASSSGKSGSKLSKWLKGSKSVEAKNSPKTSPEASKNRKASAPTVSTATPLSSPKTEPLASASENSSPEHSASSKTSSPESSRIKSESKKEDALTKTESNKADLGSKEESGSKLPKWLKGSKSTEGKNSPRPSPEASKNRKTSIPTPTSVSPLSSPKLEPVDPVSESPSPGHSSDMSTPESVRRKSEETGSKKEALKKTESSMAVIGGKGDNGRGKESEKRSGNALRKSKSSVGTESTFYSTAAGKDDVMGNGTPQGSPQQGRKEKKRKKGTGEKEAGVSEETKRIREAVLKAGKELTAAKLEPVLRKELACLTGGFERDAHQIVMVTEKSLPVIDSPPGFEEFKSTLAYFRAIMKPECISSGATLLIDARSGNSHKPAKHLLERLAEETVPLSLHMIYIFIKTGLFSFGRNKSLVSTEAASKLHLAYLNDHKQAVEQLGAENLVVEMGGTLGYSHETWLGNRIQYERIVHLHSKITARLPETQEGLNNFDVPTTVKDAEQLMQQDLSLKEKMINLFAESELKMDEFLASLKEQQKHEERMMDVDAMMSSVEEMLKEIKSNQNGFDKFWRVHRCRVEHMMSMCHFTRSGEKLKHIMQGHIEDLAEDKIVMGDSLEAALEQGEKHEAFATKCMETIEEQMNKIKTDAATLCNPSFAPSESEATMHTATQKAINAVRKQLKELTDTYQELMNDCQKKRDLFIVCVKFHMNHRQLQQWNDETMELLASLPLQEPSPSSALNLLAEIDQTLMKMTPTQVSNLRELASNLPGNTLMKKHDATSKKYDHARSLLDQRRMFLQKILSAHFPLPIVAASNSPQLPRAQKDPSENGHDETDLLLPSDSVSLTSTLSSESTSDYTDTESDPAVLKNRQFVYKELVATELDYIKDISTVIDSYYDEMDPESLSIPLRLRGKRDLVFGNLLELKTFHETVFSKTLEKYAETPERIGECFTQHTVQFQMYSLYCKNRTTSETLINESTESQAFFKGIQMKLGHALHLNSYLLKPIQRVTKYQLLLKDMMKNSTQAKRAHSDLQVALESMLKVLKNLNDSLHVLGVKGFPGSLAEQGRLLVHDPFQVSDSVGRFSRLRERHVFMFEKMLILSKKIDAPVQKRQKRSDTYIYKDHIQMALVNMREPMDRHGLQFQITIHGQTKVYTFQASTRQVKDMWVVEMRRLLQAQFSLMKDMVFQSGTLDRSNYRGKAKPARVTRDSRLFGDSFKAPPRGANPKKSLAGRLFNRKKVNKHQPQEAKSASSKKLSLLEPSASLPAGLSHAIRPTHSLAPYSEVGEDTKSDSISSDDEIAFSSDEEDGLTTTAVDHYESLAPGAPRYYTATTRYDPGSTDNGVKLTSGQEIEVIGINKYGWWWVRSTNHYTSEVEEGWVPASYLQMSPDQTMPGTGTQTPARQSALRKKT